MPLSPCLVHPSGRPLRVLVCDDNRDAADLLGELLGLYGARVEVIYSGLAAVVVAADFRPDVAIIDLWMPVKTGWQVAGELRAWAAARSLLLVAHSGVGDESSREKARDAGFDRYHLKSHDPVDVFRDLAAFAASICPEQS